MCVCTCRSAGAVSLALLPDWLTQTPASRKRHRWSSLSAHVARFSVILNTPTHKHTDKHPSLFSSSLARRIAPCLTVHPLPGPVRFMSCPGFHFKETACWPICMQSPPYFPSTSYPPAKSPGLKLGHSYLPPSPHQLLLFCVRSGLGLLCSGPTADNTAPLS